jgi:hypothetical protein
MPFSAPCLIWLLSVYWISSCAAVHSGTEAAPVPAPALLVAALLVAALLVAAGVLGAEPLAVLDAAGDAVCCAGPLLPQPARRTPAAARATGTERRRREFTMDIPFRHFLERA